MGAGIALVGTIARTSLKEADEFSNKKNKLKERLRENKVAWSDLNEEFMKQKSSFKVSLAYFLIQCARPPCFYFIYMYCSDILKHKFGYAPHEIIRQNFWVSLIDFMGLIALTYLSYFIHPFKILKGKFFLFFTSISLFPIVLNYTQNPSYIFIFQCLAALFVFDHIPASPIFYKYFPVFRRFTYTSFLSAVAKLATYVITSFGLVFMTEYFGYWGLFIILVPVGIGFYMSVNYFQSLEDQKI